jgi:protein phosphatase 1 regulatory subunit 10
MGGEDWAWSRARFPLPLQHLSVAGAKTVLTMHSNPGAPSHSPTAASQYYPSWFSLPSTHYASYAPPGWPAPAPPVATTNYSALAGAVSPPPPAHSPIASTSQPSANGHSPLAIECVSSFVTRMSCVIELFFLSPQLTALSSSSVDAAHNSYLDGLHSSAAHTAYPYSHLMTHPYPPSQWTYYQRSPPSQQDQQTLSPHVLQPLAQSTAVPSSNFYSVQSGDSTPVPSVVSPPPLPSTQLPAEPQPGMSREKLQEKLKQLLEPNSFTGAGAVRHLANLIDEYGIAQVDVPTRLEILTKVRDNAGNNYFRAWAENDAAMDITKEWLKAGVKGDGQSGETIMPLLHVSWRCVVVRWNTYERKSSFFFSLRPLCSGHRPVTVHSRDVERIKARQDHRQTREGASNPR